MVDGKGAQRLCFAAKFRDRLMGLFSRRSSDEILLIAPLSFCSHVWHGIRD